ncbi:DUF2470 domain-containing protein [Amycolatopsis viridis]|uniref:DUF2470 domain-containing protein n=1 Tax=Amycolatopsis viridis TaxID=185678 RepID=A0ABX0SQA4_9PSEU|nr:DUF2470 domain-containing protein [Amycolatopsis viridis]NIH77510.1 hypothetical protein [Amycolatopsis viridis]
MAQIRRPPAPSPAERAKTIAARNGPGALLTAGDPVGSDRVVPELHHVHPSGSVSILLRDDHPLLERTRRAERSELAVVFELADHAPVDLREPIRGLLWITGRLRCSSPESARARALSIAGTRPDPRLLDLGHGLSLLRLTPASLVLADAEGTHSLRPHAVNSVPPDPFTAYESGWLAHLETDHPDVLGRLARHLPDNLRGGRIRPLGLDRFGLRLRVESPGGDHDVRLAFTQPVHSPAQLGVELRRLVGCPFLARVQP